MDKFYAHSGGMKFIKRRQPVRPAREENIMEHSGYVLGMRENPYPPFGVLPPKGEARRQEKIGKICRI